MNHESAFQPEPHSSAEVEPSKRDGTIELTEDERSLLDQAIQGPFEPHPTFQGVEIRTLDQAMLPKAILERIRALGGDLTTFAAIRIQRKVPLHKHTSDAEIYFGGSHGVMTLLDSSRQPVGEIPLDANTCTITRIGEWHGVKSQDESGSTFFGAKFVATKK